MKKYITVAALLAAATACANASYEDTYGSLCQGNIMAYWSFDSTSGYLSPVFEFTAVDVTAPGWNTSQAVSHTETGGWEDSGYVTFNGTGGPYAGFPSSGNGATNFANLTCSFFVNLSTESSGTIVSAQGGFNVNADGTNILFYNGSTQCASYDLSAFTGEWVNVTFQRNWEKTTVYINGEAQVAENTFSLAGQGLGFQLGSNYANAGTGGKLNNTSLDEVVLWFGAHPTAEQIKTYSIPEPSAFGMLAGLGALALVASRRRRVKKA